MLKTVLLCGPMPPPVGGISIHLHRLQQELTHLGYVVSFCDESRGFKKSIFNLRSLNVFNYINLIYSSNIIHVHSGIGIFRLLHLLAGFVFRKPVVVTIHSWTQSSSATSFWKLIFQLFATEVVFVSDKIRQLFDLHGRVIPAFIKTNIESEPRLPTEVLRWFELQRIHGRFVVSSNAFRIDLHNGCDLYGLDLCVSAMTEAWVRENCALFFVIANPGKSHSYVEELLKSVRSGGLDDRILVHLGSVSFLRVIEQSDVTVRATNTDGDALSVRESLWLKKVTLASDAAARPEGTVIFKSRDVKDLVEKLEGALRSPCIPDSIASESLQLDTVTEIVSVYNSAMRI